MTFSKEKFISKTGKFLERFGLPMLLNMVVMSVIFSTYVSGSSGIITAGYFVYQAVLFVLFEKLKPRKIIRGLVYIAVLLIVIFIGRVLINIGYDETGVSFIDWFYVNTQSVGEVDQYFQFLFFCLGFFITSVIYYFTIIRYRTFGTMLVLLFPFLIYGKRDDTLSAFNTTFMLTVFLALLIHNKQVSDDAVHNTKFNMSYVIAIAVFVTFSGSVAMLLPNPKYKSQLENNNEFFNFYTRNNVTDYDNFSSTSSPRYGSESLGEILFYVKTTDNTSKMFLRRQPYDEFVNDRWIVSKDGKYTYFSSDMLFPYNEENQFNSPKYVLNMMKKLAMEGSYEKKYGLSNNLFREGLYSNKQEISFYSTDFFPRYIPAPLMTDISESDNITKDNFGSIYRNSRQSALLSENLNYTVEGNNEYAYAASLDLDSSNYLDLIKEAVKKGDIEYREYETAQAIYEAYTYVDENQADVQRIKTLAENITKDCKNDYQKAAAIVDYFENNNYIYDLEYTPPDESIEYFLFDGKIGSCSSYATAMTLMCREIGLPARYVEGFAAYENSSDYPDSFVVKDSDAHAFVETYIAGVGWMTFDPTVAGYEQEFRNQNGGGINTQAIAAFLSYFSRIVLFLGVVFVVIFIIFIEKIVELLFRIRLKLTNYTNGTLKLYRRTVKLLEISSNNRMRGYTPKEISDYCMNNRGADISDLTGLFEKTCFGEYKPKSEDYLKAYESYKNNWNKLSKKSKINRKNSKSSNCI